VPIAQAGASLLASHVQALASRIDELTKPEAEAAIDAAMLLVPGALNASRPFFEPLDPAFDASLISMIKTYIENHLCGLAASPGAISQTFGLSRSSLYRLFECEGGVTHYIMNKKLDLARQLLSNGGAVAIRSVSEMIGFKSEAHFSRAFKERFFMTPREARHLSAEAVKMTALGPSKIEVERHMLDMFQAIGKT
jgi:AraC-like DNA-binding protein